MDFSLTPQDKIRIRQMARQKLELELFDAALSAGVNPESLTMIDGEFTWQPETTQAAYSDSAQSRLRDILDVYEAFLKHE
jgi:hypothetical protein